MDNKELHLSLKCYKKQKTQQEEEVMKKEKTECSYHRLLFCFLRKKGTPQFDEILCKNFYQTDRERMQNLIQSFCFYF